MDPRAADIAGGPAERLAELTYAELKSIARRYMRRERRNHTLQATALVHEAFIRLRGLDSLAWHDQAHFVAMAATQMRRVLVDHARAVGTAKRGAGERRITMSDDIAVTPERSFDVLALHEALVGLSARSPRQHRVAELRLFGGLSQADIGRILGVTERTIKRDWRVARAWLARELGGPR